MLLPENICTLCRRDGCDFRTRCGHNFHNYCLRERVLFNPTCPRCDKFVSTSREYEKWITESSLEGLSENEMMNLYFSGLKEQNLNLIDAVKPFLNSNVLKEKNTALTFACKVGNLDLLNELVDFGIELNTSDADGKTTPLEHACKYDNFEVSKRLLELGVDANVGSPLYFASLNGNMKLVEALIEFRANVNIGCIDFGPNPIHAACESGNLEIFERLIQMAAQFNGLVRTSTSEADEDNDDDYYNATALHFACMGGNLRIVEILVNLGSDVNAMWMDEFDIYDAVSPFHIACHKGFTEIVDFLAGRVDDIDHQSRYDKLPPLYFAFKAGHLKVIQSLLKHGADPRIPSWHGRSTLELVCEEDNLIIFNEFVAAGANESFLNDSLCHSAFYGSLNILNRLAELKVDIHTPSTLHNFIRPVSLVATGPDFVCEGPVLILGMTALHIAASQDQLEAVKRLLELGADRNALDSRGKTPNDYAIEYGCDMVKDFFQVSFID